MPTDPKERIRERFPDTGVARLRLETQGVAITPLQSGELRANAVVNLLTVRDAGERSVLAANEHAGVQHDSNQEASLTLGEIERRENLNALCCPLVRPQHIRR